MNYGRWVGQNSGPIFSRLWTKVYRIKFASAGVSVVCNAVFRLMMSCSVQEILAIKLRSCPKSRQNLTFLATKFRGKGPTKLLTEFYKSESPANMWQSLVTIGQATTESRRRKNEDLNDSSKTMGGGQL